MKVKNLSRPSDRFGGIYRGRVVSNADPEDVGRVKIHVLGVYPSEAVGDDLPWALPAPPLYPSSPSKSHTGGRMAVPEEGQMVWVMFERGEHTKPVYFASAPSAPDWSGVKTAIGGIISSVKAVVSAFVASFTRSGDLSPHSPGECNEVVVEGTSGDDLKVTDHTQNARIDICDYSDKYVQKGTREYHAERTTGVSGDDTHLIRGTHTMEAQTGVEITAGYMTYEVLAGVQYNAVTNFMVTAGGLMTLSSGLLLTIESGAGIFLQAGGVMIFQDSQTGPVTLTELKNG